MLKLQLPPAWLLLWWKFCVWNTIACKSLKPQKFFSLFFQSRLSCSNFYPLHIGLTQLNEGANAWQDSHLPYIWEQTSINLLISWKRSWRSWSASSLGIDSFMILKIKKKKTNKQETEIENIISLMIVHFHQKEFLSLGNCSWRIPKKWRFSHLLASQNGRRCCIHDPPIKYRRNQHIIN